MTVLALLLLLAPAALAGELEEAAGLPELERAARGYLDGYLNVDELSGDSFAAGMEAILASGGEALTGALRRAGRSGLLLLGVALLCSLCDAAGQDLTPGSLDPVRLAGAAAVTAISAADVNSLIGLGREALGRMDDFARLLLPVMTAAGAMAGAPTAAVARQGATLLFLNLLMTLVDGLVVPLVYAYVAASAARTALDNDGLGRVAALLKWAAPGLLPALLTGVVFYLNVTGSAAGGADALARKAAKTALSGMIPVVGGILSDAAGTVAAGAGTVKATAGVMGLLVVAVLCLGPFLQLGCHYLVYKAAAALTATAAAGPMTSLMDAMGSAFALTLGAVGGGSLILYVALIRSMEAVVV